MVALSRTPCFGGPHNHLVQPKFVPRGGCRQDTCGCSRDTASSVLGEGRASRSGAMPTRSPARSSDDSGADRRRRRPVQRCRRLRPRSPGCRRDARGMGWSAGVLSVHGCGGGSPDPWASRHRCGARSSTTSPALSSFLRWKHGGFVQPPSSALDTATSSLVSRMHRSSSWRHASRRASLRPSTSGTSVSGHRSAHRGRV